MRSAAASRARRRRRTGTKITAPTTAAAVKSTNVPGSDSRRPTSLNAPRGGGGGSTTSPRSSPAICTGAVTTGPVGPASAAGVCACPARAAVTWARIAGLSGAGTFAASRPSFITT